MIRIPKGSKEFLIVDVEDRLEQITDLTGTNPTYDVKLRDATSNLLTAQSANIGPGLMQLECLVDTSSWALGTYYLFISFNNSPEIPRIGPFEFEVV